MKVNFINMDYKIKRYLRLHQSGTNLLITSLNTINYSSSEKNRDAYLNYISSLLRKDLGTCSHSEVFHLEMFINFTYEILFFMYEVLPMFDDFKDPMVFIQYLMYCMEQIYEDPSFESIYYPNKFGGVIPSQIKNIFFIWVIKINKN